MTADTESLPVVPEFLRELVAEDVMLQRSLLRQEDIAYQILDGPREAQETRVFEIIAQGKERGLPIRVSTEQFKDSVIELIELRDKLVDNPITPEEMKEQVIRKLLSSTTGISEKRIKSLVDASTITEDLAWLSKTIKEIGASETEIDQQSVWIHNPHSREVFKYISRDAHLLLQMSRLLGLVSFETIRRLRETEIHVAGSSAVAPTVGLLAALGAEHISVWDDGKISPSNGPRFGDHMGAADNIGMHKSIGLILELQGRNPYAQFSGHVGLVRPDGAEFTDDSIHFSDFASSADLTFEVIDNPWVKVLFRQWMAENYPNTPVVFVADVEDPIVGIEIPGKNHHFHQAINADDMLRMMGLPPSIIAMKKGKEQDLAIRHEALKGVYRMLQADLPAHQKIQFLMDMLGMMGFWSQTPIASRLSSAVAAKEVLSLLQNQDITGKNLTAATAPKSLMPKLSRGQKRTLSEICEQVFAWARNF